MDVGNATGAAHSLWNAVPAAVQKRLQGSQRQFRPTLRSDPGRDRHAEVLDGFAVRGFPGLACNEQAFHYLLDIERRRSEVAQRPFVLMLIECEDAEASSARSPEPLFPIVCQSVRETDFVGWYRQRAVLGAALTQDGGRATRASDIVRNRVVQALHHHLPPHVAAQLRLRLYEVLGADEVRIE